MGPTRVWYLLWAGAKEDEPSASAAAAAEGPATGTLGPTAEAAAGEASAAREASVAGELGSAAELGPMVMETPGVEVSAGGVGPWHTRGRKE